MKRIGALFFVFMAAVEFTFAQELPRFPDYQTLADNGQKIELLPGCDSFVFTLYGAPGELGKLQALAEVMKRNQLGNGFDPGPASRASSKEALDFIAQIGWPVVCYPGCADMQIMGGRCVLSSGDLDSLSAFDAKGLFAAIQLGEWGYYFHNLSINESWFRDVFGDDFEQYKHLLKPAGLKGYDQRPASRRECYETLKTYYLSRNKDLGGRSMSVTGHSHYEVYAAEWGSPLIGLELGENIAFTQSKIAFARGAARQWKRPWSVQVSPWFHGSCTTNGPLRMDGQYARGLDAGHSLNFYWRLWLHAWFSGAAMVTPENSISTFFENTDDWTLTPHAVKATEFFRFAQSHDRGIPYAPVAVVLDHLAGYNAYQGRPWGILDPTAGDHEIEELFQEQLFPGSDHIHQPPDAGNPEASYLRPTPFGELYDVLLSSAEADALAAYPVLILVGDMDFTPAFLKQLKAAMMRGSRVLLARRYKEQLGDELYSLLDADNFEILEEWTNPATQKRSVISNQRLAKLAQTLLPILVEGGPVQYRLNRSERSWIVELINNQGVIKKPDAPARIDDGASIEVTLTPQVSVKRVMQWGMDGDKDLGASSKPLKVALAPGEAAFVEFVLPDG